ncbi:MAG: fimbrillin family protein [Muribaculaceae bacterium]|nr:fimbrillin family protein [Muribaculaceae bacterium]MDE6552003.1 fimbrillin family protein [Muribaculaceae bacterium]
MGKKISIYSALAVILTLASCAGVESGDGVIAGEGKRIYFRTHLPSLSETRASALTTDNLSECRVTCFIPEDSSFDPAATTPHYSDMRFIKKGAGHYVAEDDTAAEWPDTDLTLHFFAYAPSSELVTEVEDNHSIRRLDVASDMRDQVDFITAYSSGNRQENGNSGIDLDFSHQLARVELSAWCASEIYDIEIAGVRIGNPVTQGDFNLASLMPASGSSGSWLNTSQAPVEYIFTPGESIVRVGKNIGSHTDIDHAASIMASASSAMVIPMAERIEAWEGKKDPEIDSDPYHTDKLYFSVLLRVVSNSERVVYPYSDNRYNIPAVYFAVDDDGKILARLYKIDGEYYTTDDGNENSRYTGDAQMIRSFCWAALPVAAKWEAGKIYTYKLNYTNGIGWHDPDDPVPGEPIINGKVTFDVKVSDWKEGVKTDVTVPRK